MEKLSRRNLFGSVLALPFLKWLPGFAQPIGKLSSFSMPLRMDMGRFSSIVGEPLRQAGFSRREMKTIFPDIRPEQVINCSFADKVEVPYVIDPTKTFSVSTHEV